MASFNKITIVGYLGRDPEKKYTPQGTAVCNFSVATTEKRKEGEEVTTWFRVTVWGRQAEACSEYLRKGSQVYVEGRLRIESYNDRDGNQRYSVEVNASDVQFLGRAGEGGNATSAQPDHRTASIPGDPLAEAKIPAGRTTPPDDDIPF